MDPRRLDRLLERHPLAAFASFCVFWQQRGDQRLIDFALGVMVFAYSGLLAVFLTALFTRRGNSFTAIAALLTGFGSVLALQLIKIDVGAEEPVPLAFGWKMLAATTLSFAVCCVGKRR